MDEIRETSPERNEGSEQVVFFAPELLQKAQQRQERLGALRAAAYMAGKAPGSYDMKTLLRDCVKEEIKL